MIEIKDKAVIQYIKNRLDIIDAEDWDWFLDEIVYELNEEQIVKVINILQDAKVSLTSDIIDQKIIKNANALINEVLADISVDSFAEEALTDYETHQIDFFAAWRNYNMPSFGHTNSYIRKLILKNADKFDEDISILKFD